MSHASGEPAYRFHLLRLPELLFQAYAITPHFDAADFALHSGVQAHQIVARQMIGGSRFEDGKHIRVPNLPANYNQRQIETQLLNLP